MDGVPDIVNEGLELLVTVGNEVGFFVGSGVTGASVGAGLTGDALGLCVGGSETGASVGAGLTGASKAFANKESHCGVFIRPGLTWHPSCPITMVTE